MSGSDRFLIGSRYHLHEQVGAGGMGAVYRATDRLTGQPVALKRVSVAPQQLDFNSRTDLEDTDALRVALAREFQVLASLRHPHIITVLDYGFSEFPGDSAPRPFFTMRLLDAPQDIRTLYPQPPAAKVALLVQMLQALAYLHRRGIVHRDLKPANAPVVDGQVQVLDFGLAVARDQRKADEDTGGTPAYIAPEVLQGQPASEAADLYAVGVMAYELFAGKHPFNTENLGLLIMDVVHTAPDLAPLPQAARPVLQKLMAKSPAERYDDAYAVIDDLCLAFGVPVPTETRAIRESFLQAAQFVGRAHELAQLTAALNRITPAVNAPSHPPSGTPGSAWLIGGESGVGKSRLIDELGTLAMVRGVLVLRGQGVEGGGLVYQLWREVARRLALSPDLDETSASILRELVPDIHALLGRAVADALPLDGPAAQQRLAITLVALLRQQAQPVLLLLEDLQWTAESLGLLNSLGTALTDAHVMIVGTYRDDERPDLPNKLPWMTALKLDRLDDSSIEALSVSMLGEVGQRADVIGLLRRETEGNAFFLVEVVRALAEDAGRLRAVGSAPLPETVVAGGVQQIIRRRLARVPHEAWPLLKRAAVAGREVDLRVIEHMASPDLRSPSVDNWLTACANAAVLDIAAGRWRFAHDKLREALVADLTAEERPALHRAVAEGIEAAYPNDDTYAYTLAEHWRQAGDIAREIRYVPTAVAKLIATSSFQPALSLIERALPHLTDPAARMDQLRFAGDALVALGKVAEADQSYADSLALAQTLGNHAAQAEIYRKQGRAAALRGNIEQGIAHFHTALALAQQADDLASTAAVLNNLGAMMLMSGSPEKGRDYLEQSEGHYRAIHDLQGLSFILNNLGTMALNQGDYLTARRRYAEALSLRRKSGDRQLISQMLNNLGAVATNLAEWDEAQRYYEESLSIKRLIGDRRGIGYTLNNLAWLLALKGDLTQAQGVYAECMELLKSVEDRATLVNALGGMGYIHLMHGDVSTARTLVLRGLRTAYEIKNPALQVISLAWIIWVYEFEEAFERAVEILGLIEHHPAILAEMQRVALIPARQRLQELLSPEAFAAALARGKMRDLTAVVEQVLAEAVV